MVVSGGKLEYLVDSAIADPDTFVDPINRLGSILTRSDMSVLRPTTLPEAYWGVLKTFAGASKSERGAEEVIPIASVKSNRLFFSSSPKSTVSLASISLLPFEKRIQLAGYFQGAQNSPFKLAISAPQGVDGFTFAQSLATGLGGKFRVTEKVWSIDFDANSWRRGFASLVAKAQEGVRKGGTSSSQPQVEPTEGQVYEYRPQAPSLAQSKESRELALTLLSQTISQLSDNLVEQTFAYPNTTTRLNLNNYPSLKRSIGDFVRSVTPKSNSGATVNRPGQAAGSLPPNLLNRIEANRPGELIIESSFRLSVELNLTGPTGGDSREPYRLQIL